MKLIVIPSFYPDTNHPLRGIFFKQQAEALYQEFGLHVSVIPAVFSPYNPQNQDLGSCYYKSVEDSIEVYRIVRSDQNPSNDFLNLFEGAFFQYTKEHGLPDIIHAHNALYGGLAALHIHSKYGIPFVITEHSSAYHFGDYTLQQLQYSSAVFRIADALMAVSPSFISLLIRKFPETIGKWKHVPNLLGSVFNENIPNIPSTLSAHESEFVFLSVARLVKTKGHEFLVRAFARAFNNFEDKVLLKLIGNGDYATYIKRLVKDLGLEKKVLFMGSKMPVSVKEEMLSSTVFVHPSPFETFGCVIIEALSCGLPVISTKCGGPECIIDFSNGLFVNFGNIEELAYLLKFMHQNHQKYNRKLIQEQCFNKYSQKAVTSAILSIYEDVLTKQETTMNRTGYKTIVF